MEQYMTADTLEIEQDSIAVQNKQWNIDQMHSKIGFAVDHLTIAEVEGQFREFEGTVITNGANFDGAQVNFTLVVSSIDTHNEQRDEHLRSVDFLDADIYPLLIFKGKSFEQDPDNTNKFILRGDLTLHGVTNEIVFDVRYRGTLPKDPFGLTRAGFRLRSEIDRKDFGISWNRFLDNGGVFIGDEIRLLCHIEVVAAVEGE